MTPSTASILQSMQFTFESVLMPAIDGDYQKSIGLTMLNLFRYSKVLVEQEGEVLWQENQALTDLLAQVQTYLETLPDSAAGATVMAGIRAGVPAPAGYPGVAWLNRSVALRKGQLDAALGLLVNCPAARKQEPAYQQIRQAIRQYLIDNLLREDALIAAAFTTRRR